MPPPIPAATVVLVRDGAEGLETLMLRRNAHGAFGGMWVFPGGRIDPGDGENEEGARRAAVRETAEEAEPRRRPVGARAVRALDAAADRAEALRHVVLPRAAPAGAVTVDGAEIHEHIWVTPAAAMRLRDAGEIELAPPTFVTLHRLSQFVDVASALEDAAKGPVEFFSTKVMKASSGEPVAVWHGDVAYDGGDVDAAGGRHRLAMVRDAWAYERT